MQARTYTNSSLIRRHSLCPEFQSTSIPFVASYDMFSIAIRSIYAAQVFLIHLSFHGFRKGMVYLRKFNTCLTIMLVIFENFSFIHSVTAFIVTIWTTFIQKHEWLKKKLNILTKLILFLATTVIFSFQISFFLDKHIHTCI